MDGSSYESEARSVLSDLDNTLDSGQSWMYGDAYFASLYEKSNRMLSVLKVGHGSMSRELVLDAGTMFRYMFGYIDAISVGVSDMDLVDLFRDIVWEGVQYCEGFTFGVG